MVAVHDQKVPFLGRPEESGQGYQAASAMQGRVGKTVGFHQTFDKGDEAVEILAARDRAPRTGVNFAGLRLLPQRRLSVTPERLNCVLRLLLVVRQF